MPISIDVFEDLQENKPKLIDIWQSFYMKHFYGHLALADIFEWWDKWGYIDNSRLGFNKKSLIIIIYKSGTPAGILPLMKVSRYIKNRFHFTSLEFITQSFTGKYLDIIQYELSWHDIKHAFNLIRKQVNFDIMQLSYLKEDSVLLKAGIGKFFLHAGKIIIPLTKPYEAIRKEVYSRNLRHIINKFKRRINESNNTITSEIIENKDEIRKLKENIKNVSISKLKESGKHSIYEKKDFGEKYLETILNHEKPFCSVYHVNNKLVSYNIGYIKNKIVYALDAAYDRTYTDSQKIGFGILSYDNLIKYFANQYDFLDMGFGLDDYKFRFSKHLILTRKLLIKGNTLKSLLIYRYLLYKNKRLDSQVQEKIKTIK